MEGREKNKEIDWRGCMCFVETGKDKKKLRKKKRKHREKGKRTKNKR